MLTTSIGLDSGTKILPCDVGVRGAPGPGVMVVGGDGGCVDEDTDVGVAIDAGGKYREVIVAPLDCLGSSLELFPVLFRARVVWVVVFTDTSMSSPVSVVGEADLSVLGRLFFLKDSPSSAARLLLDASAIQDVENAL